MIDDLPPLRDVVLRHGLDAKKTLGQNFLFDLNLTSRIARAATFGAVDVLLVDIDVSIDGTVDEETGQLQIDETDTVTNYGVVDEIARRVIDSGGRVLAVRKEQVPAGADAAAILRFAI